MSFADETLHTVNEKWKKNGNVTVNMVNGIKVITIRLTVSGPKFVIAESVAAEAERSWNGATGTHDGQEYRVDAKFTAVESGGDWQGKYMRDSTRRNVAEDLQKRGLYVNETLNAVMSRVSGHNSRGSSIFSYYSSASDTWPHEFGHALGLTHWRNCEGTGCVGAITSYSEIRKVSGAELAAIAGGY